MPVEMFRIEDEGATRVLALTLPAVIDTDEFDRLNESITAAVAAQASTRSGCWT